MLSTKRSAPIFLAVLLASTIATAQDDPFSDEDTGTPPDAVGDPLVVGGQTAVAATTPLTASGERTLALDPTTALGIGIGFTLPGTPAVLAHKYFTTKLGVQAGLVFDVTSYSVGPTGMEVDGSWYTAGGVAYGAYRLKATSEFALNALGGVELAVTGVSAGSGGNTQSESGIDFRLSTGLQAELFVAERISLYAQMGITLGFLGDVSTARRLGDVPDPGRNTSSLTIELGPSSMVHSFGLVWWL